MRGSTCLEFLRNLLVYRFSPAMRRWRRELPDWRARRDAARYVQEPAR